MKAILLVSHGSRSRKAHDEAVELARRVAEKTGFDAVEPAFLDVDRPSIPEGVEALVRKGASEIIVLPNFLNSGNHVLEDVPRFVREAESRHPAVRFRMAPFVGSHPRMAELFADIVRETEKAPR